MKDPLSYRNQPAIQPKTSEAGVFDRVSQRLTLKDVVMLACIVAGAFVIAANFGDTTPWSKLSTDNPRGSSFCSDEELRQMRAGHDACFDPSTLHHTESDREPALTSSANS
jgi:hypothetical protein